MSRQTTLPLLAAAAVLSLIAAGCGDQATTPRGTGTLNVGLALSPNTPLSAGGSGLLRAPGAPEVAALRLTFDVIRVFPAGSDTASCGWGPNGEGPDSSGGCPYFSVLDHPVTVDVLSLADSLNAVLGSLALPEGGYSHLAVRIADASALLPDSTESAVSMPGTSNRLKILTPFSITAGQVTNLVLDFDLSQSLHTGSPAGEIVLEPVVHGEIRYP